MMKNGKQLQPALLKDVPKKINDSEMFYFLYYKTVNWKHLNAIKQLTEFNDSAISDWLNVNVKTLREYRKPNSGFKENVKEQVLMLLTLFRHGIEVFGTPGAFENWLNTKNFYFDNEKPEKFLSSVTGVKFVDDRLTAMEYGDNV